MSVPIVNIKLGQLKGRIAQDMNGCDYYSFQGIPFAKPPIDKLRFKVIFIFFILILNIYFKSACL